MTLMKVGEYSKAFNVSVQSVYQRIKSGSLDVELKDGVKYVKAPDNVPGVKKQGKGKSECKQVIKLYKGIVKDLKAQLKQAKRDHKQSYVQLEKLYDKALGLTFNRLELPHVEAEVYDVAPKKGKKKKKHKHK